MKTESSRGAANVRIDAAHSAHAAAGDDPALLVEPTDEHGELIVAAPEPAMLLAAAGESQDNRRERLHLQAAQIAGHLRQRLHEVDRREAQLHARVAELENELRSSRLWAREREYEFQEREADMQRQLAELQASRASAPENSGAMQLAGDLSEQQQELADRVAALHAAEKTLHERRQTIEREAAAIRHSQQLWHQQRGDEERALHLEFERKTADLERQHRERQRDLDSAEVVLAEHSQQLERDRAQLQSDRDAWQQQQIQQQAALTQRVQLAEAEIAERRNRMTTRETALDKQRTALEQLRSELLGVHRQSLEMRLVAEQLWSQIGGRATPAEVTRTIAQLKLQLTEQYRLEERALADQKAEIAALGQRLANQHEGLQKQRDELRAWAAAQQAEVEAQARQLVSRELELDRQQDEHRRVEAQWQGERRRYEQQIRSLSGQLRQVPMAA